MQILSIKCYRLIHHHCVYPWIFFWCDIIKAKSRTVAKGIAYCLFLRVIGSVYSSAVGFACLCRSHLAVWLSLTVIYFRTLFIYKNFNSIRAEYFLRGGFFKPWFVYLLIFSPCFSLFFPSTYLSPQYTCIELNIIYVWIYVKIIYCYYKL